MLNTTTITPAPIPPVVPADGLLHLLMGFEASQVLMSAHQLGIFETLEKSPATFTELCRRLDLPMGSGGRLLQAAVALGLLELHQGVLRNSALASTYLVVGAASYLGGLVEYYQGEFYSVYGKLGDAVKNNHPQVHSQGGATDLFSALPQDPALQRRFFEALHRLGMLEGARLAQIFPFSSVSRLIDLGGGSGALSISLARQHPHLSISLFDLPAVCGVADRYVQQEGLAAQITSLPGNFWTEALPQDSDAILLSMVLHDWSLEKGKTLLWRCFEALPSGGHILIYEQLLNEDRCGPLVTCLTDLTMLLRTESGAEYTEAEYISLLEQAGFQSVQVSRTVGVRHLIHAQKP